MNINEAWKIMEIPQSSSDEELKIQYKSLAKKYHPDLYKQDPDKFKKINEAFQFIQSYKENPVQQGFSSSGFPGGFGGGLDDIFSSIFGGQRQRGGQQHQHAPPQIKIEISFEESITGCTRDINYKRMAACEACKGSGFVRDPKTKDCEPCKNTGRINIQNGNTVSSYICTKCQGRFNSIKCIACNLKGIFEKQTAGAINIPPGVISGNTLRIAGAGHFMKESMFGSGYGEVFIHITVNHDKFNRKLDGQNVISNLSIDLIEALKGCEVNIETINGSHKLKIPPKTKHSDILKIKNCGVKNTQGTHNVIISVEYPDDIKPLIDLLTQENIPITFEDKDAN